MKNTITEKQEKAWFTAVRKDDIETVQKMLKEGFDVTFQDAILWTALHFACYLGYLGIAELLIENGADINAKDDEDWTPLHNTCYCDNIDVVKFLINNGADITIKENNGYTPLDRLKHHHPKQYEELMEWLTEHHPEKALEVMASESVQGRGVEL